MPKQELFSYIAAFISIMLAIALTDMVQSTHRLLRDRARVRWDFLAPLLAAWVLLWVVSEFFSLLYDARYPRLTFYGLLGLLAVPGLSALLAFAVLPDEVPQAGLDLRKFYEDNLSYLVVLLVAVQVADVGRVRVYAMHYNGFQRIEPWYPLIAMWGVYFALLALMFFNRRRWVQGAALIGLFVLGHFGFGSGVVEVLPDA